MENYQNKLFPYAYNILGSTEDAKDAIQDILLKHLTLKNKYVENEMSYLIKAVINQSINIKKRNKRIVTDNIWLPEPFATEKADDNINKNEIISYSILVLLEKLNPKERAAFILKEVFDYSHKEIAEIINSTIENSRKLLSRSKSKLTITPIEVKPISSIKITSYLEDYINLIKDGNVIGLEQLLSNDISVVADGGDVIKVIRSFTKGKKAVLKLMLYVYKTFQIAQIVKFSTINHQPALLYFEDNKLVTCQIFEMEGNKIENIFSILDPIKLKLLIHNH